MKFESYLGRLCEGVVELLEEVRRRLDVEWGSAGWPRPACSRCRCGETRSPGVSRTRPGPARRERALRDACEGVPRRAGLTPRPSTPTGQAIPWRGARNKRLVSWRSTFLERREGRGGRSPKSTRWWLMEHRDSKPAVSPPSPSGSETGSLPCETVGQAAMTPDPVGSPGEGAGAICAPALRPCLAPRSPSAAPVSPALAGCAHLSVVEDI